MQKQMGSDVSFENYEFIGKTVKIECTAQLIEAYHAISHFEHRVTRSGTSGDKRRNVAQL
jgi:hypothetical protein